MIKYLVFVVIGFVMGKLMFKNMDYHGPNSKDIVNTIFKDTDGTYWRFIPEVTICPLDSSLVPWSLRFNSASED